MERIEKEKESREKENEEKEAKEEEEEKEEKEKKCCMKMPKNRGSPDFWAFCIFYSWKGNFLFLTKSVNLRCLNDLSEVNIFCSVN